MIVLPDADLDYATSAALWGGFANAGQLCASVERILVHESQAQDFLSRLQTKIFALRQGSPSSADIDIGPITMEKQKDLYASQLEDARTKGAVFVTGGDFTPDHRYLIPTVITGANVESMSIYQDETFGPVVAVTTYKSITEAIEKANRSRYALLASVITRDISLGEAVAKQIHAGTVIVNEVAYTAGLAETPWGGLKESGSGRTHAEMGLFEFVNVRHIHKPRSRLLVFKSWWWFPYTPFQYAVFRLGFELYRKHWLDRLRAFPHFLWNLAQFLKKEPRI
jgi:acyl-CoA reductase-like NAD-dependent aldehyde dehydrogenase